MNRYQKTIDEQFGGDKLAFQKARRLRRKRRTKRRRDEKIELLYQQLTGSNA